MILKQHQNKNERTEKKNVRCQDTAINIHAISTWLLTMTHLNKINFIAYVMATTGLIA